MIALFCDDLRKIRDFICCKGCHEADERGEIELSTVNLNFKGESVFASGCCRSGVCRLDSNAIGPAVEHRKNTIEKIEEEVNAKYAGTNKNKGLGE